MPSITRRGKQTCHTCWNRRYSCPVTGRMLPASQQLPLAVFFSRACRGTASEKQGAAEESCLRHTATHLAAVNSTSAPAAQPSQSSPGTEQVLHFWGPRQPRLDYKGKCVSDPLGDPKQQLWMKTLTANQDKGPAAEKPKINQASNRQIKAQRPALWDGGFVAQGLGR